LILQLSFSLSVHGGDGDGGEVKGSVVLGGGLGGGEQRVGHSFLQLRHSSFSQLASK
jgi:hypothetical protein